jgi:hypothetical protein
MPGIDYKMSLDGSGMQNGLKAVNGMHSAVGALGSLLRGDLVGAAVQARAAFVALRAAMLANPFVALVAALVAVGAALAAVAWKRNAEQMEKMASAAEKLTAAAARYRDTLKEIAFNNADPAEQIRLLKDDRRGVSDRLNANETRYRGMAKADNPDAGRLAAEIYADRERLAVLDNKIAETRAKVNEADRKAAEDQATLQKEHDDRLEALRAKGAELADSLRQGETDYTPQMRMLELGEEINHLSKEHDEVLVDEGRRLELQNEILTRQIELQRIRNQIEAEGAPKRKTERERLQDVSREEAEYAFSKLSPGQQLTAISARAREIMEKKGWEKDAGAREEMLRLRKRHDDLVEKLKAARQAVSESKPAGDATARELSVDRFFDLHYENRRNRRDHVLRMLGSRVTGFTDSDGVQRMMGSRAGGFSSRLHSSAFARTKAEIRDKHRGIAESSGQAALVKSGEEQPVDIGGEALGYLRRMAKALAEE